MGTENKQTFIPITPDLLDGTKNARGKEVVLSTGQVLQRIQFADFVKELGLEENSFEFKAITPASPVPTKTGLYFPMSAGKYPNFGNIEITEEQFESSFIFIVFDGVGFQLLIKPIDFTPKGFIKDGDYNAVSGDTVFNFLDFKKIYPDDYNFFSQKKIYDKWYFNTRNKLVYISSVSENWKVAIIDVNEGDKLFLENFKSANAGISFSNKISELNGNEIDEYELNDDNFIKVNGLYLTSPKGGSLEITVPNGATKAILQISSDFDSKPVINVYKDLSISKIKGGKGSETFINEINGSKLKIYEEKKLKISFENDSVIVNNGNLKTELRFSSNDIIDISKVYINNVLFKSVSDEAPPFYSKEDILIGGNHGLPISRVKASDFNKIKVGEEYKDSSGNIFICIESINAYCDMMPVNTYEQQVNSYLVVGNENVTITRITQYQNKEITRRKIIKELYFDNIKVEKVNGYCNSFKIKETIYTNGRLQLIDFIKLHKSEWKNKFQEIEDYVIVENIHTITSEISYTNDTNYIFMQDVNLTEIIGVMSQQLDSKNGDIYYKVGDTKKISGLDFETGVKMNDFTQRIAFNRDVFGNEENGDRIITYNSLGAYIVGISRVKEYNKMNDNFEVNSPLITIATSRKIYNMIFVKPEGKLFKKGDVFSFSVYKTPIPISDIIIHKNKELTFFENIKSSEIFETKELLNNDNVISKKDMSISNSKVISLNKKGFLIHKQ